MGLALVVVAVMINGAVCEPELGRCVLLVPTQHRLQILVRLAVGVRLEVSVAPQQVKGVYAVGYGDLKPPDRLAQLGNGLHAAAIASPAVFTGTLKFSEVYTQHGRQAAANM
jgi:hypothetical protein